MHIYQRQVCPSDAIDGVCGSTATCPPVPASHATDSVVSLIFFQIICDKHNLLRIVSSTICSTIR